MQEELKQVAIRIKELREISGISQETMAHDLEIPVDLYKQYEAGASDIPVGVLFKIASKFKVEFTTLITGEEPRLRTYAVTRNGKGVSVERRQDYQYQSLAYNFIRKKAEPFLVTVQPKPEDTPVHYNSHPGQEFNYVIEGTLLIVINGKEKILNEGDAIYFDSAAQHGMKALNGKAAKFLAIII